MGLAEVVPGVSGGTIAFVTGIYDEFIESLSRLDQRCFVVLRREGFTGLWRFVNGSFLLTLALGMIVGILLFARFMSWALMHYEPVVWGFFFGVILLSVVLIGRLQPLATLAWAAPLGAVLGFGAANLPVGATESSLLWVVFGGSVAVSAWLLPAVSGSFMLLVLGLYETVIHAVTDFNWPILAAMACGCVLGLLLFAKALRWAMTHIRAPLLCLLTGFMAGALPRLWPWQVDSQRFLPEAYVDLSALPAYEWWVVSAAVMGSVLLWLLARQQP